MHPFPTNRGSGSPLYLKLLHREKQRVAVIDIFDRYDSLNPEVLETVDQYLSSISTKTISKKKQRLPGQNLPHRLLFSRQERSAYELL